MSVTILEADLTTELERMRTTLNANRTRQASAERFQWLYLANPDGPARAWLAVDERTGETAGFTAVFPRRIRPAGSLGPVTAWNCGDFSIHRQYRSGGVAVKLRRAARLGVDRGDSPFLYAHPNDRMLPIHMRVGHYALAKMVRYSKMLRTSTGVPVLDGISVGFLRFAGLEGFGRHTEDSEVARSWPAPGELDELYERAKPALGTALVRDSAYLDWRFRQNPFEQAELMVTRRSGRLTGYAAFVADGEACFLKDWLADSDRSRHALFAAVIKEMRRRGLARISVTALETHPDIPRLRRLGFLKRPDSSTAVVYAPSDYPRRDAVLDSTRWYMTVGDRDV